MNVCRSLRRREKDIFEELEKEEDNVDKMIDEYVAQQVEEDKNPKEKPKPKPRDPNAPPRKRRKRTPSPEEEQEEEGGPCSTKQCSMLQRYFKYCILSVYSDTRYSDDTAIVTPFFT